MIVRKCPVCDTDKHICNGNFSHAEDNKRTISSGSYECKNCGGTIYENSIVEDEKVISREIKYMIKEKDTSSSFTRA